MLALGYSYQLDKSMSDACAWYEKAVRRNDPAGLLNSGRDRIEPS